MWNPFARREVRASYTDSLVNLLVRQASGSALGQASATAAVEACAALWSHALAAARLEPEVPALSPDVLATIARSLILDGESLWVIDVEGGELKLLPVGDHDVQGQSPDPASWVYRCSLYGPDGGTTRTVPAAGVVHVKYSTDPARPHRGVGPLKRAGLDAGLLSAIVTRLGEESGAPSALVIPSPIDGQAASTEMLRADLKAARGGVVLAETMASDGDKAKPVGGLGCQANRGEYGCERLPRRRANGSWKHVECRPRSWRKLSESHVVRHSVFGCIVTRPLLRIGLRAFR